jgi:hypothetical protein
LQVEVTDPLGQLVRCGEGVAGRFEIAGRRLDPRGEQQSAGTVAGRRRVAGRIQCGQYSLCTSAVAEGLVGYEAPSMRDVRSKMSATESIVKGIRNAEKCLHLQ